MIKIMRRIYLSIIAASMFLILPFGIVRAATLSERLSGRILLQVEANGEAWYVYPVNRLRYYLGRPTDAFRIMRTLGLGISEADYENFKNNAPQRIRGRIMLRVLANGEAYYVDPLSGKFIYLGRPSDAFRIMREKALGITNINLSHMPISGDSSIPPDGVVNIVVNNPSWNQTISSPITVSGQARVFENTVNIRLRNSNNKILAETFTTAQSPDIGLYGPFSKNIIFTPPGTSTGFFEIFTQSAKDGSEIDKVITLVKF